MFVIKQGKILPPPPPPRKRKFPWILFFVVLFTSWFVWNSLTPRLPEPNEPPILYSNQCQEDIKATLLSAIQAAESSLYLVMFGLSDRAILKALHTKIQNQIPTTVFYDASGSPKVYHYLKGGSITPIKKAGLMHQKIVVIDEKTIFIGSANMTKQSLSMHDNLVIGMVSRPIAKFLLEHEPFTPGYFKSSVGEQMVELWMLPDPRGHALTELRKTIKSAQKSIRIALFTFTHPQLVNDLIDAHKRGVNVSIVVDLYSGLGASAKAVETLKNANVPIYLSQGTQLLHHKFIYVDEKKLLTGSANWTKSAFYRNSDCILALHNLRPPQKKFMDQLWTNILTESKRKI